MANYVITLTEVQRRELLIALAEKAERSRKKADEMDELYSVLFSAKEKDEKSSDHD